MQKLIQKDDIVEVLENDLLPGLVGKIGVVKESLNFKQAVVSFPCDTVGNIEFAIDNNEKSLMILKGKDWSIPWKYLKVIESKYDDRVGELEQVIMQMEDDLSVAQACIGFSEELRDIQEMTMRALIEEIDLLKKELYHARGF